MSDKESWKEGAWIGVKPCPKCGQPSHLAIYFKNMGKREMVACEPCGTVFLNGKPAQTIDPRA